MCFNNDPPSPPPPAPLPPAPTPPPAPPAPLPTPEPVEEDLNPAIQQAQSNKPDTENASGSGQLLIPLNPNVNTGQSGPAGGLNQ